MEDEKCKWKCGECGHEFYLGSTEWAVNCPECNFYHCGDDQCCIGEMFVEIYEDE